MLRLGRILTFFTGKGLSFHVFQRVINKSADQIVLMHRLALMCKTFFMPNSTEHEISTAHKNYEGCPSKLWTFVITRDCVPVIL